MEMYNCPVCLAIIRTAKEFGVETCPECQRVWGLGDLKLNQPVLDKALAQEQAAEIHAENAWLREAEGMNRWPDPEDEYERALEAMDPQCQAGLALMAEHNALEYARACIVAAHADTLPGGTRNLLTEALASLDLVMRPEGEGA